MYLVYWASNDNAPTFVIKRTLPAAVVVYDDWINRAINAGDYQTDIIGIEYIDDSQPEVTIHSDPTTGARIWDGSEYPDPDDIPTRCKVCGSVHSANEDCPYDDHRGALL